ncbi:hypothetical protein HN51_000975 [Arachis hypogaea]|uniref:Cyclin-dependent kinase inhibitor domain-containing protein n=2 Tax=Arachis TaxID=3817 RepID=A0A445EU54_ARAHY|nr:cyclin-dependent kinase inhibitor 7 [Arachis duranensis]XP_025697341.1 cyclin-dependent kinase inhibitor 7 [Arachis hypogaea]QHO48988.1 Cyclin-dependent kinase inhibitor [Arachis hypogaea]RYR78857.1 hypothetical protein Ahy_A01g003716 [Arachis hypogaea]
MEMAEVGVVRTRASAALAMDVAVATAATSPSPDEPALKRRKIKSEDETSQDLIKFSASSFSDQLKSSIDGEETVPREAAAEEEEERSSDESPASCCSSNNGSSTWLHEESIKFLDLEVQSSQQAETSACYCENQIRREMSLTSELGMNWQEVESSMDNNYNYNNDNNNKRTRTTTIVNNSRVVLSTKMPTELELEEFFATAEKDIQKRFSDKYNFDIVKDLPLEGRYEWIQVKLTP